MRLVAEIVVAALGVAWVSYIMWLGWPMSLLWYWGVVVLAVAVAIPLTRRTVDWWRVRKVARRIARDTAVRPT